MKSYCIVWIVFDFHVFLFLLFLLFLINDTFYFHVGVYSTNAMRRLTCVAWEKKSFITINLLIISIINSLNSVTVDIYKSGLISPLDYELFRKHYLIRDLTIPSCNLLRTIYMYMHLVELSHFVHTTVILCRHPLLTYSTVLTWYLTP